MSQGQIKQRVWLDAFHAALKNKMRQKSHIIIMQNSCDTHINPNASSKYYDFFCWPI